MRILIIEDDEPTGAFIAQGLREAGHAVDLAPDGREGLSLALSGAYDVLVVDRMLPHIDGLSIIQTLRAEGQSMPILILSALGEVDDRVEGLRKGGDDYLVKPFAFSELLARIDALMRRADGESQETKLAVADLEMDLLARKVKRAGTPIELQPREFRLLEYLMRSPGRVLSRMQICEHVWNYDFDPGTNLVDVYIKRLRAKIDRGRDEKLIQTARGVGDRIGGS